MLVAVLLVSDSTAHVTRHVHVTYAFVCTWSRRAEEADAREFRISRSSVSLTAKLSDQQTELQYITGNFHELQQSSKHSASTHLVFSMALHPTRLARLLNQTEGGEQGPLGARIARWAA